MLEQHGISRHAGVRMRQRGLRDADLGLALGIASQVAPDAYLITRADADREIARRKAEIQRIERLKDLKIVVAGGTVVSCYPSRRTDQQRTLREGRTKR